MSVFVVEDSDLNIRADIFVSQKYTELSRSTLSKLFVQNKILVNGNSVKPSYKVKSGDKFEVNLSDINKTPEEINFKIIYEDDDCIVLDKPEGVLTHSKGVFNSEYSIASFIHKKAPKMAGNRAGIVHRLDRATSGVIICAKKEPAMKWLQKQFSIRKVNKTYVAVVEGHLEPKEAVLDLPIERNPKQPQTFRVGYNGKSAITKYKVQKSSDKYDLVILEPQTGRTHQLRVHMQYLKHPIVGDILYGSASELNRMMLHASKLELTLPNKERKVFESKLPILFDKLLNKS